MRMTRREFVRGAGLGLSAYLLGAPFAAGSRAQSCPDQKLLFVLFLRGGADGVNLVIPRVDHANYTSLRPEIGIPAGSDLPLDPSGHFTLHPSLAALKPLYDAGQLAVVHAVGGTNRYSHFEAMDAMEFVAPGATPRGDGWLHAMLVALGSSGGGCVTTALRGVSLAPAMISSMRGNRVPEPVSIALPDVGGFAFQGAPGPLATLYAEVTVHDEAGATGRTARELVKVSSDSMHGAVGILASAAEREPASAYANVPPDLAAPMRDAARLVKEPGTGLRALAVDFGGWDHHYFENSALPGRAAALAGALASFYEDIGPVQANRVVTLVVSEFGRTAFQNGTGGTDHGYGNVMFVVGGGVQGGRVLSRLDVGSSDPPGLTTHYSGELVDGGFPGLGPNQLHVQEGTGQRRDLKATTDFREVFAECMVGGLAMSPAVVHSGSSLNDPAVVLGDYVPPSNGLGLFT
jgi:uncharacterized protein (DUF1501 family)